MPPPMAPESLTAIAMHGAVRPPILYGNISTESGRVSSACNPSLPDLKHPPLEKLLYRHGPAEKIALNIGSLRIWQKFIVFVI